ncbi:MAG TPA: choice-of-anchor tandem repeat NxxGxxAF-containing protein [Herpetosiphonaceae bacterium]
MHRSIRTILPTIIALTLIACLAVPAQAQSSGYTFTILMDSAQGLTADRCAAINNNGQVAFTVTDENFDQFIMRAEPDGTLTTVADTTERLSFVGANPSINDQGDISFAARLVKGGEVILVTRGKSLKTVAKTGNSEFNFFGFNTSLNNQGLVAFSAELDEEFDFDEGTFVGDRRGNITTIYLASTSQFTGSDSRRSINDAGQIAFEESLDTTFNNGIFLFNGSSFVTIVDQTSPLVDFATKPQVNNAGVVVFQAFLDSNEQAIITGSGGALTVIADTLGPFGDFSSFGGPSINDSGEVAFNAALDGTFDYGIYTGPDPLTDSVIDVGDPLGGSTVVGTVICSEGLNNDGQIAFVAFLEDGRTLIVRADPIG